jgi:putative endonuclease
MTNLDAASTTAIGRTAEAQAADYLTVHNYVVLDRNWRNRWCEIDLVAREPADATTNAPAIIHFVEVKYRRNVAYGYAAEYVSHDKVGRLIRAAAAWCQAHHYAGPYQIDIIAVEGALAAPRISLIPNAISA